MGGKLSHSNLNLPGTGEETRDMKIHIISFLSKKKSRPYSVLNNQYVKISIHQKQNKNDIHI